MDYNAPAQDRWHGHPWLARALRIVIFLTPVSMSVAISLLAARFLPASRLGINKWLWWFVIAVVSTAVLLLVERVVRRLAPLTALLKMTLIFPDEAPSRFGLAMRTGTTKQLERLVERSSGRNEADDSLSTASIMLELVAALGVHDRLTRGHCERVRAYTDLVIEELDLPEADASRLRWVALLHDVGKLRVPREILSSDRRPTDQEWELLATHPDEGMSLTAPLAHWLGPWRRAIGEHHERWDGNGYPKGLLRDEIHLGARIVAVTDAFDVMTSARSYKKPIPAWAAREEIARCTATQFDPTVVRAFLSVGLRRLRLALGPLAWISNLPLVGRVPIVSAAANTIGSLTTAIALTVATLTGADLSAASAQTPVVMTHAVETSVSAHQPSVSCPTIEMCPQISPRPTFPAEEQPGPGTTSAVVPGDSIAATTTSSSVAGGVSTTSASTMKLSTTTAPITTSPQPTTIPIKPGAVDLALYFTDGTSGATTSDLTTTKQPVVEPEPDSLIDKDANPGLTIKSSAASTSTKPEEFHDWVWTAPALTTLNGPITLDLFSSIHGFNAAETAQVYTDVLQCNSSGANCVLLLQNNWLFNPWNHGTKTWVEYTLPIGTLTGVTVPQGQQLRIHLEVGVHDIWIAMSGNRPTALHVTI